jgi:hypothetical protein
MNLTKEDLINLNEFIEEISKNSPSAAAAALEAMDMADKPWLEALSSLKLAIDHYVPVDLCGQSECGNCGEVWKDEDIKPLIDVHHLWERISPGEIVPSGECPDCGALCHSTEKAATKEKHESQEG